MARLTRKTASILLAGLSLATSSRTALSDVVTDCKSGDPARAIKGCSIVIESGASPLMDLASAYTYRANAAEASGDHARALADLSKAIELNPSLPGNYNNRGNVYLSLGDLDHALLDYNEAIRLDLNFGGAYFNRGNLYSRRGDLAQALTDLTAAAHLSPMYPSAYFNRGIVYFRMGRTSDAIADFRKTLELNPQHQGALRALRLLENSTTTR